MRRNPQHDINGHGHESGHPSLVLPAPGITTMIHDNGAVTSKLRSLLFGAQDGEVDIDDLATRIIVEVEHENRSLSPEADDTTRLNVLRSRVVTVLCVLLGKQPRSKEVIEVIGSDDSDVLSDESSNDSDSGILVSDVLPSADANADTIDSESYNFAVNAVKETRDRVVECLSGLDDDKLSSVASSVDFDPTIPVNVKELVRHIAANISRDIFTSSVYKVDQTMFPSLMEQRINSLKGYIEKL